MTILGIYNKKRIQKCEILMIIKTQRQMNIASLIFHILINNVIRV